MTRMPSLCPESFQPLSFSLMLSWSYSGNLRRIAYKCKSKVATDDMKPDLMMIKGEIHDKDYKIGFDDFQWNLEKVKTSATRRLCN
jgi:hypothetical protein